MAVWHTARPEVEEHSGYGWLGRSLDGVPGAASMLVGPGTPPLALGGRRAAASAIERLDDFTVVPGADPRKALPGEEPADELTAFVRRSMLDAYATADRLAATAGRSGEDARYPSSGLGERLRLVARLLKAGAGARVFYTTQSGYDTHSSQAFPHQNLLSELSGAVTAFLDDLAAAGLADRVAVLCFSEFGRRVAENGSAGTDHGTASAVFLAGHGVRGGLVGKTPSLTDLEGGDVKVGIDFRQVYATILEDWLGLPSGKVLAGDFDRLPLFRR